MKVIKGQNYSRSKKFSKEIFKTNIEFIDCNFSQEIPFTKLTIQGCKFVTCNLTNCDIDWSKNSRRGGNITQREEVEVWGVKKVRIYNIDKSIRHEEAIPNPIEGLIKDKERLIKEKEDLIKELNG